MKYRNNIFFLGMTITYCILFTVQAFSENILAIQVYVFVAWTSLSLSVFELLKTVSLILSRHLRLTRYIKRQMECRREKEIRIDKIVMKLVEVLSYFEYIFILVMAILTPLKNIPNNLAVNKQINCLSLLSFAMIFLNIFLYQCGEESYRNLYDKVKKWEKAKE